MAQELLDDGLVIIDKPPGHTSHEISAFVKRITGAKRTGHAGTLDPEVSGVLPVALGRATKLLRYIAGETKVYVGIIKFRNVQTPAQIEALFKKFTGELVQTPPKISAVRKVPRKRTIYSLRLLEVGAKNPRLALFEAKVGAGTYIRTLCEDIGKECGGARMEELRRTAVGEIKESDAVTMERLTDAMWLLKNRKDATELGRIISPPQRFIFLPKAVIKDSAIVSVRAGAQIAAPAMVSMESVSMGQKVALYSESGKFVGVGIARMSSEDLKQRKKGIVIKPERVHV
jgi:H/ACA ribonucleoprotein complex subunit 4